MASSITCLPYSYSRVEIDDRLFSKADRGSFPAPHDGMEITPRTRRPLGRLRKGRSALLCHARAFQAEIVARSARLDVVIKAAITGNFLDIIGDRNLDSRYFAAISRWCIRNGFDKKRGTRASWSENGFL